MKVSYLINKRSDWTPEQESDHLLCTHCYTYRPIVNAPWTCPLCTGEMEERNPNSLIEWFDSYLRREAAHRLGVGGVETSPATRDAFTYLFCKSSVQFEELRSLVDFRIHSRYSYFLPPQKMTTGNSCNAVRILVPGTFVEEIYQLYSAEIYSREVLGLPDSPDYDGYTDENQVHYMNAVGSGGFAEPYEPEIGDWEQEQDDFKEAVSQLKPSQRSFGFSPTHEEIHYAQLEATVNRALLLGRLNHLNHLIQRVTRKDWECHQCQCQFQLPDQVHPPYPYWYETSPRDTPSWKCPNCQTTLFVAPVVASS